LELSIEEIKPYENNPRIHENTIPALMESIKKFGFINPIIIDENNVILVGHARYEAVKILRGKLEKEIEKEENKEKKEILEKINKGIVPVLRITHLTEEQKREYRLVDNKIGELSVWDEKRLLAEIEALKEIPLGFSVEEIEEMKASLFSFVREKVEKSQKMEEEEEPIEELLEETKEQKEEGKGKKYTMTCPNCGYKFDVIL